jgi:hypothetical protein
MLPRLYALTGIPLGLRKTGWSARPAQADTDIDPDTRYHNRTDKTDDGGPPLLPVASLVRQASNTS